MQPPWIAAEVSPDQQMNDYLRLLRQAPAITEIGRVDASGREVVRFSRLTPNVVGR